MSPTGAGMWKGRAPRGKISTMAELTAALAHAAGPSPGPREVYVRPDLDSRVGITGVSSTPGAVYIVTGPLEETLDGETILALERGPGPAGHKNVPLALLKARAYDLLARVTLKIPLEGTERVEDIHEIGFEDPGGHLALFIRIRDVVTAKSRGTDSVILDEAQARELLGEEER